MLKTSELREFPGCRFAWVLLPIAMLALLPAQWSHADKRIKILGWNVEARGNDSATIAQHLRDLDGFDILGLSEVNKDNFNLYRKAAGHGEGTEGESPRFRYIPGKTGGDIFRLAILYDTKRFEEEEQFELHDIQEGHRAPLVARFKLKDASPPARFLFMVNHLARRDEDARGRQAKKLQAWAAAQTLPVIAVGDYNFDYSVDQGEGNPAFNLMLKDDVISWVRPPELYKTSLHPSFNGVLDFVFTAHFPDSWKIRSRILVHGFPLSDTDKTSDHRPVQARIFIPSE